MTRHYELITETTGVGRCACGWAGPDRGLDPAPARADAEDHVFIARVLTDAQQRALPTVAAGRRVSGSTARTLYRAGLITRPAGDPLYPPPRLTDDGLAAYRALTSPEWTCHRCREGIWLVLDGEPHDDPEHGGAVHDRCCASCHPELAERYGIELQTTTDDLRVLAEAAADNRPARHNDGALMIAGHGGGITRDHAATAEAVRRKGRTAPPAGQQQRR